MFGICIGAQSAENPNEETTKTYYIFLAAIPVDFAGVAHMEFTGKGVGIDEKTHTDGRQILLKFD